MYLLNTSKHVKVVLKYPIQINAFLTLNIAEKNSFP